MRFRRHGRGYPGKRDNAAVKRARPSLALPRKRTRKGALEECAYEAQTTGDSSLALLSMAERIEHPKIKELARNLEISIRYMADLTTLVDSSRRSAREYLRMEEERKGMLREAGINMALLLGMSVFALLTVDRLIDVSVWKIVSGTLPGHLAVGVYGLILFLFLQKQRV